MFTNRTRARLACGVALVALAPLQAIAQAPEFGIVDNSFLIEEAFNQDRGFVQSTFTWARDRSGAWEGNFTQEWPAPALTHQLSYSVPLTGGDGVGAHVGGIVLNYRYQVSTEGPGRPRIAARLGAILPSGRAVDSSDRPGIQLNVAFSKQSGRVYIHGNTGFTWVDKVPIESGARKNLTSPFLAGSLVWNNRPSLNLMLESLVSFDEQAAGHGLTEHQRAVTVSPGVRGGWTRGDQQMIVGAAIPVTRAGHETTAAILAYLSYELPFTKNR
jgi:hypothetical protein